MFISTLKHTSTLKRMPVSCGICFLRTCLDFNGYFDYCKSENTRANHPYKMQTKPAKVLTPLSTPSLWKSSKTGTIYLTTSLLMKSDCPTFWVCKMGIFFNHRQITWASIGWATWGVWNFSPRKFWNLNVLKRYFQCFERTILSKMFAKSHKSIAILCLIFFACLRIRVLDFN